MWEKFQQECVQEAKKKDKKDRDTERVKIPEWLERYVEYKFHLYDRTGKHFPSFFCCNPLG